MPDVLEVAELEEIEAPEVIFLWDNCDMLTVEYVRPGPAWYEHG